MARSADVDKSVEVFSLMELHGMDQQEALRLVGLSRSELRQCSSRYDHLPTPAMIAEECLRIRSNWTSEEHAGRTRENLPVIDCDFEQVRRDAKASLQKRLVPMDRVEVVEETADRGDAVSWELEGLVLV